MPDNKKIYGYARVSSADQNEARQIIQLREKGVKDEDIFLDKKSGVNFDRPAYKEMTEKLKAGDMLYVSSIDRLGRDYDEILKQWSILTTDIGIDICVIDMPLLDTTQLNGLLKDFITSIVLQIFSFVAQMERDNIRKRQREGIDAAKVRGVKFGRPEIPLTEEFLSNLQKYREGKISIEEVLSNVGMSRSTFYRKIKKYELKQSSEQEI